MIRSHSYGKQFRNGASASATAMATSWIGRTRQLRYISRRMAVSRGNAMWCPYYGELIRYLAKLFVLLIAMLSSIHTRLCHSAQMPAGPSKLQLDRKKSDFRTRWDEPNNPIGRSNPDTLRRQQKWMSRWMATSCAVPPPSPCNRVPHASFTFYWLIELFIVRHSEYIYIYIYIYIQCCAV